MENKKNENGKWIMEMEMEAAEKRKMKNWRLEN